MKEMIRVRGVHYFDFLKFFFKHFCVDDNVDCVH